MLNFWVYTIGFLASLFAARDILTELTVSNKWAVEDFCNSPLTINYLHSYDDALLTPVETTEGRNSLHVW